MADISINTLKWYLKLISILKHLTRSKIILKLLEKNQISATPHLYLLFYFKLKATIYCKWCIGVKYSYNFLNITKFFLRFKFLKRNVFARCIPFIIFIHVFTSAHNNLSKASELWQYHNFKIFNVESYSYSIKSIHRETSQIFL